MHELAGHAHLPVERDSEVAIAESVPKGKGGPRRACSGEKLKCGNLQSASNMEEEGVRMAQFCTKCGSPLGEGMQFCTGCGATVGEPLAPVAQPVAPVAPAPVPVAPAAAKPATSSSPVLKIVLIVLAVFVLLGLLSAGACVYMVYRAKQKMRQFEHQVQTTFPTPSGSRQDHTYPQNPGQSSTQSAGPVIDLGLPVYPGATPTGSGTNMTIGTNTVKSQDYLTGDSTDQVVAFYKEKLGSNAMVTQNGAQAFLQLAGSNGYVNIAIAPDSPSGKTRFKISSVGK